MNIRRLVIPLAYSVIAAFVAVGAGPSRALAQQDHTHMATFASAIKRPSRIRRAL